MNDIALATNTMINGTPLSPVTETAVRRFLGPIAAPSGRMLTARSVTLRGIRSTGHLTNAERYGWLSLAGLILSVPAAITLRPDPDRLLPLVGLDAPPTTLPRTIPGTDLTVDVPCDPAGYTLFTYACTPADSVGVLPDGRRVGGHAIRTSIIDFIVSLTQGTTA